MNVVHVFSFHRCLPCHLFVETLKGGIGKAVNTLLQTDSSVMLMLFMA